MIFRVSGTQGRVTLSVFRDLRWSHLGYISRHTAVTMGLCGFTQPNVSCMLGHRSRLTNFGKVNLVGVVSSIVSGQHYGCVVLSGNFVFADTAHTRRHIPIGDSVAGKGGVAYIAARSSPTGLRGVALPETVL